MTQTATLGGAFRQRLDRDGMLVWADYLDGPEGTRDAAGAARLRHTARVLDAAGEWAWEAFGRIKRLGEVLDRIDRAAKGDRLRTDSGRELATMRALPGHGFMCRWFFCEMSARERAALMRRGRNGQPFPTHATLILWETEPGAWLEPVGVRRGERGCADSVRLEDAAGMRGLSFNLEFWGLLFRRDPLARWAAPATPERPGLCREDGRTVAVLMPLS